MARSNDPKKEGEDEEEEEIWGTWEELLLACAVNRHGTRSWDSVACELRSRVSSSSAHALTADLCRHRYRHLHHRLSGGPLDHDGDPAAQIPWLDRLRSLRVAELRQQLHRSDVSIGSLQLKVKRLKEERERSLKPPDSDPDKDGKNSCKESNSTEPKPEEEERIRKPDPAAPGSGTGTGRVVGGGETSYNGSSDTIAKGADPSPATDPNPVNESGESVAESKGGEPDGNKESSDVQSSASLTRRRHGGRLRKAVASDSAGGGAADAPAEVESQPLISVLGMLRSSEYGPIFDRRLESQESESYASAIRRHVDFEMIQRRIGRNGYSSAEFFRDLLLLCANAIFFFPASSQESIAAVHLRELVNREISTVLRKSSVPFPSSAGKEATPPPAQQPPSLPLRPDADRSNSSPHDKKLKPTQTQTQTPIPTPTPATSLPLLVVCRKRSSIAGNPPKKVDKEEEPEKVEIVEEEEKEEVKEKEEEVFDKKSTKQRSTVARGLRTNKTRDSSSSGGSKAAAVKSPSIAQPSPPAIEDVEPEPDPKPAASAAKKRSAANFLNRMKRSSPLSSNGLLLDMLKNSSSTAAAPTSAGKRGGGGSDPKKKSHEEGRKEKEKERVSNAAVKRSVGRPPKRAATAPPSKRRREETKTTPPSSSKKRARR
ncbi:uncharacterized protein M6B38_254245 [Iris pallida]|uniref:Bromo domain-containing protein n=1 Tax=Iris pallida TaxID=29817 RepID=A0AAX6IH46_IRIPA|nr:uncharacterized protein M6B38_254245 [Iris pallida]